MLLAERSNPATVFTVGKVACFVRSRALLASRAVISTSTSARSSSSGAHRCAFAVISISGATRRMLASLSRRRPCSTSADSGVGGGGGHQAPPRCRW